jgi:hypothetical protein
MDTIFKYNNKIITTPNLEKKLKQMKIQLSDIEIIELPKKIFDDKVEDNNKRKIIVRSTEDNIRRICYINKDKGHPPISELFKNQIWNPITKTGIKDMTDDYMKTMYYE